MRRREFLAASAAALACTARLAADEKSAEKLREPDLVLERLVGAIAFSPDSKMFAVASGAIGDEFGICFVDPTTGKRLPDFERTIDVKTNLGWPRVLGFSPDGKYFAAGGQGYVALWDAQRGRRLENIGPASPKEWGTVTDLCFTRKSDRLFQEWAFGTWGLQKSFERVKDLERYDTVAISPNGELFATRVEGIITVWTYPGLQKARSFGVKRPNDGPLIFSADGRHIVSLEAIIDGKGHCFWNIKTGNPTYIPFTERIGYQFDLSPNGSVLAAMTQKALIVFRVSDGQAMQLLNGGSGIPEDYSVEVKFAPNGKLLASSRYWGTRIWKDADGFTA
jgi:WD40 repeat protein